MKKFVKFLGIAAFIAVICFSITACPDPEEDDSTAFDGTWVNTDTDEGIEVVTKIVADKGNWSIFITAFIIIDFEYIRGTYTVSGNEVTLKVVEIRNMFGNGNWVSWADYTDEDDNKPESDTMKGTISDNTFTVNDMGMTFTKQQ